MIVAPFKNAELPVEPSAKELGIIKEETKFEDLTSPDAVNEMIKRSFLFSADVNLLGACTNHLKLLCWFQDSLSTPSAIWLTALLGHLVDRAKQGNCFTEDAWRDLKARKGLIPYGMPEKPAYKDKNVRPLISHVIDFLQFKVVEPIIDDALATVDQLFRGTAAMDEDLRGFWRQTKIAADTDRELKDTLENLVKDLDDLRDLWIRSASSKMQWIGSEEDGDPDFSKFDETCETCLAKFDAILPPAGEHPLIARWRSEAHKRQSSEWRLLRASALYSTCNVESTLPWYMAEPQLALLKLEARHRCRPVDKDMYAMYKPDAGFIKRKRVALSNKAAVAFLNQPDGVESVEFADLDDFDEFP